MSSERTAEIWSTRLQRELLALTEDDAGEDAKAEVAMLPPFVTVKDHSLDIAKGLCKVSFLIEVDPPKKAVAESKEQVDDEPKEKGDGEAKEETGDGKDEKAKDEEAGTASTEGTTASADGKGTPEEDATASTETSDAVEPLNYVTVTLDPSLDTKPDGTVEASPSSYPFQKPRVILVAGSELFPDGSNVKDGDLVDIDVDWTPSLHLSDAVMNVALKIRESIRREEPFFAAVSEKPVIDPMEVAQRSAKKIGNLFSSMGKGFGMSSMSSESAAAHQQNRQRSQKPRQKKQRRMTHDGTVRIGDVIDFSESPWNFCEGMYSCKAIRRPEFVEATIVAAQAEAKKDEVAGAGFAGAGSMFRTFTQSAKSVFEESFIMITDENLIELRSSKLNMGSGTVSFVIPISFLAKLKFRREESISLFFKQAPDDPLIYMCPDSAACVQQIQNVLKRHGVKGKHTNAATQRSIQMALALVAEIQKKEKALDVNPTPEKVEEIMDLYRQAAEKFEVAGDARHEEVMSHMHKFLAKPVVASILDGSYEKKKAAGTLAGPVPQGEVLENHGLYDDHDDDEESARNLDDSVNSVEKTPAKKPGDDSEFHETMDDILQEAKRDLENFGMDDDLNDLMSSSANTEEGKSKSGGEDHDPVAELDAMLSAADKELSEIMES